MRVEQLLIATGGILAAGSPNMEFHGAVADSRNAKGGELFVALPGIRSDGHNYVQAAVKAGAAAVMVSKDVGFNVGAAAVIRVDDTLKALQAAALSHRLSWSGRVVGVTGSVGKTGTREICASILSERYNVLRSEKNYNNEIGVPLTLLALSKGIEVAVIEMGMRGSGEIAALACLACPEVGLVTCIGETHLEHLGSVENIARAKAELVQALPADGTAVLPADDPYLNLLKKASSSRCITFGLDAAADIRGENISEEESGISFDICSDEDCVRVFIPLPGRHNVLNSLAAAAVAVSLGVSLDECTAGLAGLKGSSMRLEMLQSNEGFRIISDVYNAGPASTKAAIDVLSGIKAKRRIAVLADMLELGSASNRLHREIGAYVVERGTDILFTYGSEAAEIGLGAAAAGMNEREIYHFSAKAELAAALLATVASDDVVLVKGSRGMAMEEIVGILLKPGVRNNPSP